MVMQSNFFCSACGKKVYKEFEYPVGWWKRLEIEKRKLSYSRVIRNNAKYVVKIVISGMPTFGLARFKLLRARASRRRWLSRSQIPVLARNLQYGASFFQGKKIRVCEVCGFGAVFPMLSEKTLAKYYAGVYGRALEGELTGCENARTTTLYKIAENYVPFERLNTSIEL
jgi:hypothetical protein